MTIFDDRGDVRPARLMAWIVGVLLLLIVLMYGFWFATKAIGRYQKEHDAINRAKIARIDAENEARVNELRINAQKQRVLIAQQEAEIRYTEATGIKRAQDEIAKTLTPLYVQHEWIEAYKANPAGATVYIPAGESGVPVVRTTP